MRRKRLLFNTISSIFNQLITFLCGFILPGLILRAYGSETNGLVASITQYLHFISFLDLGVGAVVQSAYYRPLANRDERTVSLLFADSKRFFRTIASVLIIYVIILCYAYPKAIHASKDQKEIILLILAISFSSFAQYYFAVAQELLLKADQRSYIQSNVQIITIILNTIAAIILIKCGISIQGVKLVSSVIFLIRPIILSSYIKKHYKIDYKIKDKDFKIEQKWNGLAQHCATVVMNNTDVMLLTVFARIQDVSIYSVYYMVINGIKQMIVVFSNGASALFGNVMVCEDEAYVKEIFDIFSWIMHTIVIYVFSLTLLLICPFVMNYTNEITDANYYQPIFAVLLTVGQGIYCIRIPYNTIICAVGHFRQTQKSALIEMVINLGVSVLLVRDFGLVGVSIGTIAAISYRTIYFIYYLHENILFLKYGFQVKQIICDILQMGIIVIGSSLIPWTQIGAGYFNWFIQACIIGFEAGIIIIVFNCIFFRRNVEMLFKKISDRYRQSKN